MNSRSQYILRTINKKSNQTSESLKGALIIPMEDYHISIIMDDKFKGKRSKAIQTAAHSMAKQLRSLSMSSITITDLRR